VTSKIEEAVVTFTRFLPDWSSGFAFCEIADGTSIWFSSSAIYQNKGAPDQIEKGDLVTLERFEHPKAGRGPAARRVWLKAKAASIANGGH
jgi:hypothetical protein